MRRLALGAVFLLSALTSARADAPAPADAPTPTTIERAHVRLTFPAGWVALPDVAAAVAAALADEQLASDVLAYGDGRLGVFGVVAFSDAKAEVAHVHAELDAFATRLRAGLGPAEAVTRWVPRLGATRLVVELSVKRDGVVLVGKAVAVVDRQHQLHGVLVQCARSGDALAKPKARARASAACDALLASFTPTWSDAELERTDPR